MILVLLLTSVVSAYVPSVESLFRNGKNGDISVNTLSIQAKIEKISEVEVSIPANTSTTHYIRWIYQHSGANRLKMVQLEYSHPSFGDQFLIDKHYVSQLSPMMFPTGSRGIEQGGFYSLMNSLLINDGSFLVEFLASKDLPVALNENAINGEKHELLLKYKNYVEETAKNNKIDNPIEPIDRSQYHAAQSVLNSPYIKQSLKVKIEKWQDEFCWKVESDLFEAWVTDQSRQVRKVLFKSPDGEFEVIPDDFMQFGGVHSFPRTMLVRTTQNEYYKIQFSELNYFSENEAGFINRLKKLDQKNQNRRSPIRPSFIF